MSGILTVPARLALMAKDASDRIVFSTHRWVEVLDSAQMPAVVIEMGDGDYPPNGAGAESPQEIYNLYLLVAKYGQGGDSNEAELLARQMAYDVITYFVKHPQLQMSNRRGLEPAPLPSLTGVKWARYRRNAVTTYTKGNSDPYWGFQITVTVELVQQSFETIVPR